MKSLQHHALKLAAAALIAAPALASASNLLTNGGFDDVGFPLLGYGGSYAYVGTYPADPAALAGWTGSFPILASDSAPWGSTPNGAGDLFHVGLQSQSHIAQSIDLASAGTYTLSWYDAARSNLWQGDGSQTYEVRFGNTVLATETTEVGSSWTHHELSFSASAGTHWLSFAGLVPHDATAFLDSVSLSQSASPTTAVPEPTEWAMLLLGLAGMSFQMRRRRQ